jgi:predicted nucleic acid-binding protein
MRNIVLDANILIRHWRRNYVRPRKNHHPKDALRWGRELIRAAGTNAIVTPVYIEMIAGASTAQEARLTVAFLQPFRCVDKQETPPGDWKNAMHLAAQARGRARDLGDCLIRAIANRLHYGVRTDDTGFPT